MTPQPHPAPETANGASLSSLYNAPILPKVLNAAQKEQYAQELLTLAEGHNLADLKTFQEFAANEARFREAMVQALHPDATFSHEFAHKLQLHFPGMDHQIAMQAGQSFLINRRDDQAARLALIQAEPGFLAEIAVRQKNGETPKPPEDFQLTQEKRTKLAESFALPDRASGPEPAIHILANAFGQKIWHEKLAIAMRPEGPLEAVLAGDLARHAPGLPAEFIAKGSRHFMKERHVRAQAVTDSLSAEGGVVQEAIRMSEDARVRNAGQPLPMSGIAIAGEKEAAAALASPLSELLNASTQLRDSFAARIRALTQDSTPTLPF